MPGSGSSVACPQWTRPSQRRRSPSASSPQELLVGAGEAAGASPSPWWCPSGHGPPGRPAPKPGRLSASSPACSTAMVDVPGRTAKCTASPALRSDSFASPFLSMSLLASTAYVLVPAVDLMVTLLVPTDVTLPACLGPNRPGPWCPPGPASPPGPSPVAAYDVGPLGPADGEDAAAPKVTARTPPATAPASSKPAAWAV